MAYRLRFDGTNDYVSIPAVPASFFDGTGCDAYVEIEFTVKSTADATLRVFSSAETPSEGGSSRILINTDGTLIRFSSDITGSAGSTLVEWSSPFTAALSVDQEIKIRIETDYGSGFKRLYVDGVDKGLSNTTTNLQSIGRWTKLGVDFGNYAQIDLKYFDYVDRLDATNDRYWNPSSSNGTGSVLPEDLANDDGTLVNFPTDDSQWVFYAAGGTDSLSANDISSTSQVSSPAIGQTHALTANDVSSLSSVTAPALGQTHSLSATDVQSTSQVSSPSLATQANTDNLSANDISSTSSVSAPALGQVHNLAANDAISNTETSAPTLQQTHALTSVDVSSLSTVSSPSLTSVAGHDSLAANDMQATSTVSSPTIGQVHNLTANDLSSNSETDSPNLGQVHALTANDITSATQVSTPTIRNASQVLTTPVKNTKATVSQTTYKAAIIQPVYKAEAG